MDSWGPELAVILGVVEGLTEFLPVSSTGHLIVVGHFLGFTGNLATSVEISIQLGAILAIVAYERTKIAALASAAYREQAALRRLILDTRQGGQSPEWTQWGAILRQSLETHRSLWFLSGLLLAFCPSAAVGLLAHQWIKANLFSPQTVAGALIVGGLIILAVEARRFLPSIFDLRQVRIHSAFLVGLAQCFSLFPGVSRSGATIIGGMLAGMDRKVATEYSFFLALPTMIAATSYQMVKSRDLFALEDVLSLGLGLLVAFLIAWAVIAGLLAYVKHHSLRVFAYYRIVLGLAVLLIFH